MINYVTRDGENLYTVAYKFNSKVSILLKDNPSIKNPHRVPDLTKVKVRTVSEYSQEQSDIAMKQSADSVLKSSDLYHRSDMIEETKYKNRLVRIGQIGTLETLEKIPLYRTVRNGTDVMRVRDMQMGEVRYVFGSSDINGEKWLVGPNEWVEASNEETVLFTPLPEKLLEITGGVNQSASVEEVLPRFSAYSVATGDAPNNVTETKIAHGDIEIPLPIASRSVKNTSVPTTLPAFENPNYRRPVLRVKNDKETISMEMRVMSVSGSYSNTINATKSNGGWFFNLSGANLSVLNISGYWLDTKTNREFDQFLNHYKKFIEPQKSGQHYSMSICEFFYKERLYKGLIASFSYSDRQEESLHRKFQMQLMVLHEKGLNSSEINSIPYTHDRGGKTETEWLSDINNVIKNPIRG
jgi:hypothetical protein